MPVSVACPRCYTEMELTREAGSRRFRCTDCYWPFTARESLEPGVPRGIPPFVRKKVREHGLWLILIGLSNAVVSVTVGVMLYATLATGPLSGVWAPALWLTAALVSSAAAAGVTIAGGRRMWQLRTLRFCRIAAWMAILPSAAVFPPLWLLGLILGIQSLRVMAHESVKRAFALNAPTPDPDSG